MHKCETILPLNLSADSYIILWSFLKNKYIHMLICLILFAKYFGERLKVTSNFEYYLFKKKY